jgi:two-component system, OmpR family, sensor histidine kinase PrrB
VRRSLRFAFSAAAAAIVCALLLVAGVTVTRLYAVDQRAELDGALRRQAQAVSLAAVLAPELVDAAVAGDGTLRRAAGVESVVRAFRDGALVADVGSVTGLDLPEPAPGFTTVTIDGTRWRLYAHEPAGARDDVVQVARPLDGVDAAIASVRRIMLAVGLAALLGALGLGWWAGGALVAPLARLRDAAASVTTTRELRTRVPADGPAEVQAVAESINTMLARLEASVARTDAALVASRSFAASVAHELRTPLTSIRANLEFLHGRQTDPDPERAAAVAEIATEQARLIDLLDGLRLLALGDAPAGLPMRAVDLAELVDERVQLARRRHPGDTILLEAPDDPVPVRGWSEGLAALVDNLVANALVHGRRGGAPVTVRVRLGIDPAPGDLRLVVDDDGPGVPAEERPGVFERFARASTAASGGSGLGLALVAQQAAIHGGAATVADAPGGGARFDVRLRGAPPPAR